MSKKTLKLFVTFSYNGALRQRYNCSLTNLRSLAKLLSATGKRKNGLFWQLFKFDIVFFSLNSCRWRNKHFMFITFYRQHVQMQNYENSLKRFKSPAILPRAIRSKENKLFWQLFKLKIVFFSLNSCWWNKHFILL